MDDKEEKKETVTIEKIYIGERIEFKDLFRVKGKQGLFTINSTVNKSGMISMLGFADKTIKHTVAATKLICLWQLQFETQTRVPLDIEQVFINYEKYLETGGYSYIDFNTADEIMAAMVPDYDECAFKPYHAEKVRKWYNEIKEVINPNTDEDEK